mmetsp:Transcript_9111/g.27884  ORF Transcript_9111/g.27884 Transcript_9111/m.27884 type:complete len:221 (-) Transcript_9111:146-808(-)
MIKGQTRAAGELDLQRAEAAGRSLGAEEGDGARGVGRRAEESEGDACPRVPAPRRDKVDRAEADAAPLKQLPHPAAACGRVEAADAERVSRASVPVRERLVMPRSLSVGGREAVWGGGVERRVQAGRVVVRVGRRRGEASSLVVLPLPWARPAVVERAVEGGWSAREARVRKERSRRHGRPAVPRLTRPRHAALQLPPRHLRHQRPGRLCCRIDNKGREQ